MRLKKIEIFGFKSFADKTAVVFHEGITAIVGPNGCGKSNISDAFRWVMGEQSAKSMRGSKMYEVIFSGASQRKALNFAEVTLTLTDIQGMLPTEYEEIAITRRVYRSGESDYLINGNQVRLKDVQDLFLDSGVGKSAFSIFEQGKIDEIIRNSPLERRSVFEEAAGIARFNQRKREALRKLEQTDANIERAKDIHQEVERQIIVLEQQAEKARLFKENKVDLEKTELALFSVKWENLKKRIESTLTKEQEKQSEIEKVQENLTRLEEELHLGKKTLTEGQLELQAKREEVYKKRSEKEIKSKEWQSGQQRLQEIILKEKQWLQELNEMMEKRKLRHAEAKEAQIHLETVEEELKKLESARRDQRERLQVLESEVNKVREGTRSAHQELLKWMQIENRTESELKQDTLRLEHNQERKAHLEERKSKLNEQLKEQSENLESKKEIVDEFTEVVDEQRRVVLGFDQEIKENLAKIESVKKELDAILREIAESHARQKVLLRIREQMEGFSVGSKKILQEAGKQGSPLYGKVKGVYESITPAKGSEKALAVALRPYTQTLVVETKQDLSELITFAKTNGLKDYSVICMEAVSERNTVHQAVPALLDKVSSNALSNHLLRNIYTTSTLEEALSLIQDGVEVWTDEGSYVDQRGVLFFCTEGENNIFIREAEIQSLGKRLKEKEEEQSAREEILDQLTEKKSELQSKRSEIEKSLRQDEMKLVEANFAYQRYVSDLEKIKSEKGKLDSEIVTLNTVTENLHHVITDLKNKHIEAKAKVEEVRTRENDLSERLAEQTANLQEHQNLLRQIEPNYQKVSEEQRRLSHAINVFEVKDMESEQQEKRLQDEIQRMQKQQEEIQGNSTEFQQMLEEVEKALAEVTAQTAEFELHIRAKHQVIEEMDQKIAECRKIQKELENDHHQHIVQQTQLDSSLSALESELGERYHMTGSDLHTQGLILEMTIEKAEREVRSLRRKIEEAGDINMTSIEEFDKHKERYEFLSKQIDDLEASKKELIEIITQLDTESRKIFKDTFEIIRENFKKNYQILFNGGEADLEFTESGDVLEAGIEIIAKPPGKQMRSISLLSGGEKCMTAVALLFAIFEVKPAPFCILDEIDAPLDDSNVERFLNVVKKFVDRCQFIIITHNKRTMSIADVIFGVSMQEKGVSRLLALEFNKESTPEPILVE